MLKSPSHIEVQGPQHFYAGSGARNLATEMKSRHLTYAGWCVIEVHVGEVDACTDSFYDDLISQHILPWVSRRVDTW